MLPSGSQPGNLPSFMIAGPLLCCSGANRGHALRQWFSFEPGRERQPRGYNNSSRQWRINTCCCRKSLGHILHVFRADSLKTKIWTCSSQRGKPPHPPAPTIVKPCHRFGVISEIKPVSHHIFPSRQSLSEDRKERGKWVS